MTVSFDNRPLPVDLELPHPGLLNFINQFGELWVGKISAEYFKEQFHERKQLLLANMTSYFTENQLDHRVVDANFRLMMIRKALVEQWRHPGFMYYNQPPMTGNSRLLASGLGHCRPWENFNFLVFAPIGSTITQVNDPIKITTDDQFWQILGLDKNPRDVTTKILLDYQPNKNRLTKLDLVFHNSSLYQKNQTDLNSSNSYLDKYQSWQRRYKHQNNKFNIGIFTDWPELITNSDDHWNVDILGPTKELKQRLINPGNFEKAAWDEHHNNLISMDHILWVIAPRKIDLSELLFWMDLEHTTYIDQHWDFILYRRDCDYKSRYVSLSNF